MKIENSGKIYRFSLDFDLGHCYAQLVDYSDKYDFDGRLIYTYHPQKKDTDASHVLKTIDTAEILYGPVPLLRYPNVKGKGAWKYLGKINKYIKSSPVFKKVQLVDYNATDWSELKTWYKLTDFEKRSDYLDYEEVRHLEKPVLHTTRDIEIRTTMYVILQNKKKVEDYYDLKDQDLKFLYVELINTCFDKKSTRKYLKSVE